MDPVILLAPICLPIIVGFSMLLNPIGDTAERNRTVMTAAVLTSFLTLSALVFAGRGTAVIFTFTDLFYIAFRIDGMSTLYAGMLSVLWPFAILYGFDYMKSNDRQNRFFAYYLMTFGITLGAAFAENLLTLYVFYELLTLVTLPLVTHYENAESIFAGWRYIVYCITGAALAFFTLVLTSLDGGGSFVYGGSLSGIFPAGLMRAAFLIGFFGFGTKAALFPLYIWLPTASAAPTPVTALLHAVAVVNTGMYSATRLVWYVFGPDFLSGTYAQTVCILATSFTMVFAAVLALKQRHFKRRLAYSTMSNLSYMLLGVSLMTPAGLLGGLTHMLFHSVIKMTLFLCAGAVIISTGRNYIYEMDGMGKKMPLTFACYTLGAISLSGIPPFCGFVSKWRLLTAGAGLGTPAAWIGVGALIIAALLCAVYTLSVSVRAFFPAQTSTHVPSPGVNEADRRMLVPIVFFTVLNLLFGIFQAPVIRLLSGIAGGLY